ncbi:MAG: Uncharacterized glycosyl hydrolase Rv3401, partial [uncultured Frankineae bacterium]
DRPWHLPGRPLVGAGAVSRPRGAGADRVGLRAVERPHRPARQPGRGGAARHPRHLPQLVLREPSPPLRRGGLRLPRGRSDRRRRHQRQALPAA